MHAGRAVRSFSNLPLPCELAMTGVTGTPKLCLQLSSSHPFNFVFFAATCNKSSLPSRHALRLLFTRIYCRRETPSPCLLPSAPFSPHPIFFHSFSSRLTSPRGGFCFGLDTYE